MFETKMSQLVVELQEYFLFGGEHGVHCVSDAWVGKLGDNIIHIVEACEKRHETGFINVDWKLASGRNVKTSVGP